MTNDSLMRFKQAIAGLSVGAFAGVIDGNQSRFTLHIRAGADVAAARRAALAALRSAGVEIDVKVLSHTLRSVASPRSIEHWLKVFATGTVIFDPTLVAQRAQALLDAARTCRHELGKLVSGIYFHPGQRVMYVVIPSAGDQASALGHQQRLVGSIGTRVDAALGADRWPIALRVTSKVPRGELTPVDAASAPFHRRLARFIRRGMVPGAVAVALTSLAVPAAANTAQSERYGVLWSLSVFSDGQSLAGKGTFAAKGLESFFGDDRHLSANPIVRFAQTNRRVIIRDTDANAPDSGGEGPGPGPAAGPATAGS
jgi:hypothetical protein